MGRVVLEFFFFSSRRRHTRCSRDWSSDVCSSDLGWLDVLIMRVADIQLSFPAILIALILLAVLGQGTGKIIAALVTVQWAYYARTVRSAALVEREKE